MAAAAPLALAVEAAAEVQDRGATVSFKAPGRPDVPSDGSPHKVRLAFHEFGARFDYVTAPKLVTQAYRRARVVNDSGMVLLAGAANLFHEEEFVGTTRLKTIGPKQEFELFLGVDDRIQVERRLVEGSVEKRLLLDVRRSTYAYEVKVVNLGAAPATVTVLEQIPVSRHETVKVRRTEIRPPATREDELGGHAWELQMAPGEQRTVRFAFTIENPRDLHLLGLPALAE